MLTGRVLLAALQGLLRVLAVAFSAVVLVSCSSQAESGGSTTTSPTLVVAETPGTTSTAPVPPTTVATAAVATTTTVAPITDVTVERATDLELSFIASALYFDDESQALTVADAFGDMVVGVAHVQHHSLDH